MANYQKNAQETSKSCPITPSKITSSEAIDMFEKGAIEMADYKDKQTAEALHNACIAIMEDLGSKLGRIQLKAADVLNKIPDDYVAVKMDEIIDTASEINRFAMTFEYYLRKKLGLKDN